MKRIPIATSILLLLCFYANAQSELDRGIVRDGVYINTRFGFSFQYPKGWTVHGDATVERMKELGKEKVVAEGVLSKETAEVAEKNSNYLLTVFRHPIGTPGIAFNPGVLIMAENIAHAPGITNGKHYLLNVRVLKQRGKSEVLFKEPTEHTFDGWKFFRDDFVDEVNGLRVIQSFFVSIAKDHAVIFIFTGEDQKSIDETTKSMETFDLVPPVRRGVTIVGTPPKPKPTPN